ncbi:VCBS repeat-containing protein [Pseudalkalibacillus hwajinpoensis]|uniref:VCBS repeat-containing protein n=1 Tax=Guptibacillus hwajinpoensis TaxID=208199 RepID=UPI00325C01F6
MIRNERIILDQKVGDVTGDGIPDRVVITGVKPYGSESPFVDEVILTIRNGSTSDASFALPGSSGYNPTLYLGDFTGNKVNEILVRSDSGGSGGITYDFLYSYLNQSLRLLFDQQGFYNAFTYSVNYLDYYQAKVENQTLKNTYIVSLLYKGEEYLSEIYDEDGKLKQPVRGDVLPPGGVYPIDLQRDGIDELLVYQRVIGRYNADGLGFLSTPIQWQGNQFVPMYQTLCIFG